MCALVVAALFGVAGYATFTSHSQGDLLENYCWDDDLINFSRILFSISILLTFPIECFVTREVLHSVIGGNVIAGSAPLPAVGVQNISEEGDSDKWGHKGLTLGIIAAACLISTATDCLGPVLELNGVLAAVPLAYILPGLAYLRLEQGGIFARHKLPALGLALFGLFVALLGLAFLFVNFDTVDTCTHGKVMKYCLHNETLSTTVKSIIKSKP
uniref:Putative sodium-coupled neutral amino acid transporter 11 n=1 Tax=Xenopsylla cheopis TaxID=163159 RepID=A0A6M2DVC3_XENCH